MHDTADLVIEAMMNSIEAGAGNILVTIHIDEGMVNTRVEDDGLYTLIGDPFGEGVTTKGEGRGHGLPIIKERSEGRCRLTRGDGITVLEFTARDDGSFNSLSEALLPVLSIERDMTITIWKDGREIEVSRSLLEERGAVPDRAEGIRRYRRLLESLEKGDIYG